MRRVARAGGEVALGLALAGAALSLGDTRARADDPKGAGGSSGVLRPSALDVASYTIDAKLDPHAHTVTGSARLTWTNSSRRGVEELWFHLYLNAWKNDRTLFQRSPFGGGRGGAKSREHGWVDVKRLVIAELGSEDLWPARDRHSPNDPEDETDIRLPLPEPIAPGRTVTITYEFESKLPTVTERTGFEGSFHMVAQWFPKIARLEADGTWAHFAFHPHSEFYADFGRYDVTLDAPESFTVGATGRRVDSRTSNGRLVARYVQESVHDFAFTAWDRFRERSEHIDGVDVRLLYPPGHDANADATLGALRFALPHLSSLYGRYPYEVLTVVHPPSAAMDAGGMEYPTLITTGGPWWIGMVGRAVEAVTIHELGHQWFYGVVATNEHEWPYLDEGLNTYADGEALERAYGSLVDRFGLALGVHGIRRARAAASAQSDIIAQGAADFASFRDLGGLVYGRTGTILETLARVYGREKVALALGRYTRRFRFGRPLPSDLLAALREDVGEDAAIAAQAALHEGAFVNFVAREVEVTKKQAPHGVFDTDAGRRTIEPTPPGDEIWASRVIIHREGTLRFPVEVEIVDRAGARWRVPWDARDRWTAIEHTGKAPVTSVHIDPDRRVLLDQNLLDNGVTTDPSQARTLERLAYAAGLLLTVGGP